MAEALDRQLGPQPSFQRMVQLQHDFASELDKLQNIPQFDTGRAILEAIKNLGTELNTKIDGLRTELTTKIDRLNTKVDGLRTELTTKIDGTDAKIDRLQDRMRIRYMSFNYLSLFILTNPVTKTLRPVFKTPIFTTSTKS
jgi:hypothetical protein